MDTGGEVHDPRQERTRILSFERRLPDRLPGHAHFAGNVGIGHAAPQHGKDTATALQEGAHVLRSGLLFHSGILRQALPHCQAFFSGRVKKILHRAIDKPFR